MDRTLAPVLSPIVKLSCMIQLLISFKFLHCLTRESNSEVPFPTSKKKQALPEGYWCFRYAGSHSVELFFFFIYLLNVKALEQLNLTFKFVYMEGKGKGFKLLCIPSKLQQFYMTVYVNFCSYQQECKRNLQVCECLSRKVTLKPVSFNLCGSFAKTWTELLGSWDANLFSL